ncbi:T-lymphocyte surface antigen Ly-9-like isoform X3 [Xiphophorus couchianus]|uniref:T-lymphocyte surface antigen Ly-9-like isoform X3 n=1 Tax=Xiphophorus couchianus TaxID=32473 RepID=UPI0010160350|nr:T-lymphocyte surface antigen Ly-9-like isoform X3 [Xiphophorus couchianus]
METQITFICLFLVILGFSAGQEEKENLTGIVGGTITLPGAVTEKGYLLYNGKNIASVFKGEFDIDVNIYKNKLQWNRSSGLFTITNLQKNDSGTYTVQKGEFSSSYKLQVYDPAPTPAVTPVNVTSDPCLLICSVDKPATLLWIRDKEIQNQSRSALSLPVTVHTEDRDSSYRCVAANPAENKTVDVNLMSSCGFKQTQTLDYRRTYWIAGGLCIGFIVLIGFGFLLIQKKFLVQKSSGSQTQGRRRENRSCWRPGNRTKPLKLRITI